LSSKSAGVATAGALSAVKGMKLSGMMSRAKSQGEDSHDRQFASGGKLLPAYSRVLQSVFTTVSVFGHKLLDIVSVLWYPGCLYEKTKIIQASAFRKESVG
jgi:hypothetical protein